MIYLVCTLFSDGDGYTQEVPEKIFKDVESAKTYCLDIFIKRAADRIKYESPEIYREELHFAQYNPNRFKSEKILYLGSNLSEKEMDNTLEYANSWAEFSIREMELK